MFIRPNRRSACAIPQNAGFTLLEIMIAAGVVLTGLMMLMGSLFSVRDLSQISDDRTRATSELASIMEEMRGLSYSDLLEYQPAVSEDFGMGNTYVFAVAYYSDGTPLYLPAYVPDPDVGTQPPEIEPLPNPVEIELWMMMQNQQGHWSWVTYSGFHRR